MTSGAIVLLVAVAVALVAGSWRLRTDGRFGGGRGVVEPDSGGATTPAADVVRRVGGEPGERATLLQFSSAFCAPCRATRRVLADVAAQVEGVVHVEVDAEQHLDATRALGVSRTPTTLVLDARGREVSRASGAPTPAQVIGAIGRATL